MKSRSVLISMLVSLITLSVQANIDIHKPYVRAMPPNAPSNAVFMTLINHGDSDVTLIKVTSTLADKIEFHQHIVLNDLMKMRRVDTIIIPAKRKVILQPGGLHIMIFDAETPLEVGDQLSLSFIFSNGTTQEQTIPVNHVMMKTRTKHDHDDKL